MYVFQIKRLEFKSYLKLNVLVSFVIGFVYGLMLLLISLISEPEHCKVNLIGVEAVITGPLAGLVLFITHLILFPIYGMIFALISFHMFNWILKFKRGITVYGDFEKMG